MYQKFARAIKNLRQNEKGMTGLETAIVLIAFVTVASVLAYSVLSAGVFSAERGKETVYSGLEQAQSTMELEGGVLGISNSANTSLDYIEILVGLNIPDEKVDMAAVVVKYYDAANEGAVDREATWGSWDSTANNWVSQIAGGSTERGNATVLESDELHVMRIDLPSGASRSEYDTFTFQILPSTGAALTIQRTLPSVIETRMDLQ